MPKQGALGAKKPKPRKFGQYPTALKRGHGISRTGVQKYPEGRKIYRRSTKPTGRKR